MSIIFYRGKVGYQIFDIGQFNIGFYEVVVYKYGRNVIFDYLCILVSFFVLKLQEMIVYFLWYLEQYFLYILNKIYSEKNIVICYIYVIWIFMIRLII